MRLWAIQVEVSGGSARASTTYPQVIVEADNMDEARERAKERVRRENSCRLLGPDDIKVHATSEIGLENIWIFNDARFHNVESNQHLLPSKASPRK